MMEFFAKIVNGLNLMDDLQSFHKRSSIIDTRQSPKHASDIFRCINLQKFLSNGWIFCHLMGWNLQAIKSYNFLRIWSNLLKKSLMENSIFCAMACVIFSKFNLNFLKRDIISLTYFNPMLHFYTPWKRKKIFSFSIFLVFLVFLLL